MGIVASSALHSGPAALPCHLCRFIATRGIGKLEAMFVAGERCDPDTVKWAHSALQRPVIDHYWLTELGWPCCANFKGLGLHPTVPGSAGA